MGVESKVGIVDYVAGRGDQPHLSGPNCKSVHDRPQFHQYDGFQCWWAVHWQYSKVPSQGVQYSFFGYSRNFRVFPKEDIPQRMRRDICAM